jgi:hypothetical protein
MREEPGQAHMAGATGRAWGDPVMDDDKTYLNATARKDYEKAHQQVFLNDVKAFLQGEANTLLPYEEVRELFSTQGQVDRGIQMVPLDAIRGSVDRSQDFDRDFLPRNPATRERWIRLDRAALAGEYVPPVQLYKIGDIYFVKDGNHRVSVARQQGATDIEAEVIEATTSVPLRPDTDPRELLRMAEYARFLEQTNLDKLRPGATIIFTSLGRYDELLEHISAHRWYLGIEQQRPVSWEEAVLSWYDNLYLPMVRMIKESGILRDFPSRTVADLYLWTMDHRYYLALERGTPVGMRTAVMSYDAKYGAWHRRVAQFFRHLTEQTSKPFRITKHLLKRALAAGARMAQQPHLLPLLPPYYPDKPEEGVTLPPARRR